MSLFSGIGLALCERLLSYDSEGLQLCLACRNMQRAQAARTALLASHPGAQVALLQMDTSSISSVVAAAQEVKLRWDMRCSLSCCTHLSFDVASDISKPTGFSEFLEEANLLVATE